MKKIDRDKLYADSKALAESNVNMECKLTAEFIERYKQSPYEALRDAILSNFRVKYFSGLGHREYSDKSLEMLIHLEQIFKNDIN